MTAHKGMMPQTLARYNSRRQRTPYTLHDTLEIAEPESCDVLDTIVRLVGDNATLILLEEYGGTRMFVPIAAKATKLVTLIGERPAQLLSEQFGGRYVRLPVGKAWRGAAYHKRGWTYPKIAKALCMTDSAVARMLKKERERSAAETLPVAGAAPELEPGV